jgi:signal recognition particle receptor subunit beta
MALFNYATREITLKIVYYGPGLSGKTTNLQHLHAVLNPETRGKLLSLSTEADRTLFFDFLPVELCRIKDFSIRFQLYTVPGQVRYNATRKVVLKGADAVIFVADSQRDMKEQNLESFSNMRENLLSNNLNPDDIPILLQYNKRDLANIFSVSELNRDLNPYRYPFVEASAISGAGVEESFKLLTKLLLKHIAKKHRIEIRPATEEETRSADDGTEKEPETVTPLGSTAQSSPPEEEILELVHERDYSQDTVSNLLKSPQEEVPVAPDEAAPPRLEPAQEFDLAEITENSVSDTDFSDLDIFTTAAEPPHAPPADLEATMQEEGSAIEDAFSGVEIPVEEATSDDHRTDREDTVPSSTEQDDTLYSFEIVQPAVQEGVEEPDEELPVESPFEFGGLEEDLSAVSDMAIADERVLSSAHVGEIDRTPSEPPSGRTGESLDSLINEKALLHAVEGTLADAMQHVLGEIQRLSDDLGSLRETVTALSEEMKKAGQRAKHEDADIINVLLRDLKSTVTTTAKDVKDIREQSKDHKTAVGIMRDVQAELDGMKKKKKWFRFS